MILLQILDEGSITDSQGRKVDFKVYISSFSMKYGTLNSFLEHYHLSHKQSRKRYISSQFIL
jgi:ATP-dependent Clp protease ATP-binding subunit ClpA